MREFAESEWQRAHASLEAARKLTELDPDSSASRAYYAAFHAVTALFALREREFKKHTALRAAVHRDLVKTGEWRKALGADFDFLVELRQVGDYGGISHATPEDASQALACAERLLAAVADSCPLGSSPPPSL